MIRRAIMGIIALAASLLGCDGSVVDGLPHHPPPVEAPAACVLPAVGSTCPAPLAPADARAFVQSQAWCPDGADLFIDERPGGDVELACAPAGGGWRIVVGVVGAAWGVAYLAADGSLVVCDLAGRVDQVLPLLTDPTSGRHWHALSADDGVCLVRRLCSFAFEQCEAPR